MLAERVGFEPTVPLPARQFSRLLPSTTRSPLQWQNYIIDYTLERYGIPLYHLCMRTTQRKGDLAVAQAIATFTRLGYDSALPITESAAYDIIVDKDNKLYRVQVRYSSTKDVELRRIHSNSKGYVIKKTKKDAYDWLYVLFPDRREYLVKRCMDGRRSIKPGEDCRILSPDV